MDTGITAGSSINPVIIIDIDIHNVDTVRPIIAISVIHFPRGKRHPSHGRCRLHPTDKSWPPIDLVTRGRYPAPAMGRDMSPPSIMIRRPTPRLFSNPDKIVSNPDPAAMTIRNPVHRDMGSGCPDRTILSGGYPAAISPQVPSISRQFLRQILLIIRTDKQRFILITIPFFPGIRQIKSHQKRRSSIDGQHLAGTDSDFALTIFDQGNSAIHRDLGIALPIITSPNNSDIQGRAVIDPNGRGRSIHLHHGITHLLIIEIDLPLTEISVQGVAAYLQDFQRTLGIEAKNSARPCFQLGMGIFWYPQAVTGLYWEISGGGKPFRFALGLNLDEPIHLTES